MCVMQNFEKIFSSTSLKMDFYLHNTIAMFAEEIILMLIYEEKG